MTTSGDPEDDRLRSVGERLDEARRAADVVADQQNLTDDERRAARADADAEVDAEQG